MNPFGCSYNLLVSQTSALLQPLEFFQLVCYYLSCYVVLTSSYSCTMSIKTVHSPGKLDLLPYHAQEALGFTYHVYLHGLCGQALKTQCSPEARNLSPVSQHTGISCALSILSLSFVSSLTPTKKTRKN